MDDGAGSRARGDARLAARLVWRAMRYRWKLNRAQIAAMLERLPRGGVGLDVGAHKGAYSWWMARRVGPAGRVLAFEPQDRVARPTARALARLGLGQVTLIGAAVSDRSGEGSISVRRSSTHGASMEGLDGEGIETVPVRVVSLDDAARDAGLARVDFVKVDVEGHELAVLRGAREILERHRPAILVEVEARHRHGEGVDPLAAVRATLEPLGYRGWFFRRGARRPIEEFDAGVHQSYGRGAYCNDFLFERAR